MTEHPELFHYTSIEALDGILRNNTLWATCATHLNDSSEMQLIWSPMKDICTDFFEKAIKSGRPEYSKEAKKYAAQDGPGIVRSMQELLLGGSDKAGLGIPFVTSYYP